MPSVRKIRSELRDLERELTKYNRRVLVLEQRKQQLTNQLQQGNLKPSDLSYEQEGGRNEAMSTDEQNQHDANRLPVMKTNQAGVTTVKQHLEYTLKMLRQWSLGISQIMLKTAAGLDSLTAALSVLEVAGEQIQKQLEEATAQIKMQLANPVMPLSSESETTLLNQAQSSVNPQDLFSGKQMEMMLEILKSPFFAKMLSQLQTSGTQQQQSQVQF